MSNLRQAAEDALEALEWSTPNVDSSITYEEAITALRAALAEPDQEPVAWMYDFLNTENREEVIRNWVTQDLSDIDREKGFNVRPLYTAPPQRKPLTEEEIMDLCAAQWASHPVEVARAVEQAHGIKGEA